RAGDQRLLAILVDLKLASSRSDAERLLKQGAVEVDGSPQKDVQFVLPLRKGTTYVLRVGKRRYMKLVVD
ncbi:MAG: S4 domain-containing protein, partial [Candidatus Acidiferrales bacterium]